MRNTRRELGLGIGMLLHAAFLHGQSVAFVDSLFPVRITLNLVYDAPLELDLYEPVGPGAPDLRPAFIAIHGGGLTRGDKATANMVELCREMPGRPREVVAKGITC